MSSRVFEFEHLVDRLTSLSFVQWKLTLIHLVQQKPTDTSDSMSEKITLGSQNVKSTVVTGGGRHIDD